MAYGKDERHVHKHVWKLPIPEFDPLVASHARLSELAEVAHVVANGVEIDTDLHFSASRRKVRAALEGVDATAEINELVYELLS